MRKATYHCKTCKTEVNPHIGYCPVCQVKISTMVETVIDEGAEAYIEHLNIYN
jgi:Zn finger protein HypA/HybF involved in hydrogenase expression